MIAGYAYAELEHDGQSIVNAARDCVLLSSLSDGVGLADPNNVALST